MTRYLHSLSAVLFYLLGLSFFAAYTLSFNNIIAAPAKQWMHSMDLPLLLVGLLYGGTSVYLSLTAERKGSSGLAWTIGLPLAIVFITAATLKFWPTPFVLNP